MTLFLIITILIIASLAVYTYLKKFNLLVVGIGSIVLIAMWLCILLLKKYLQVMIESTRNNLQKKEMSSESDSKEIIGLLGEEVCKQLKAKF